MVIDFEEFKQGVGEFLSDKETSLFYNKSIEILTEHHPLESEYVCVIKDNEMVYFRKGKSNKVEFDKKMLDEYNDSSLTVIHSHPNSTAFSRDDFKIFLQYKAIKNMLLLGNIGKFYFMQKLSELTKTTEELYDKMENLFENTINECFNVCDRDRLKNDKIYQEEILRNVVEIFFFRMSNNIGVNYYPKEKK